MKPAKMSMCLIVKNEPFLEQCLKSFRDYVEEIVIVDTGSTDGITQEIAKKYADIFEIYTACNNTETGSIEDFSKARNRAFELATKKCVCWADADDEIIGAENFSKIIDEFEKSNSDLDGVSYLFPYLYAFDGQGECILRHYRERLFSNKDTFHFVNPVHEVAIIKNNARVNLITRDDIVWKHHRQYIPNKVVEPNRNLRILKAYVENDGKDDARQYYYLGLEYKNSGDIENAIKCHTKYVEMSGWDDEKCLSLLELSSIYQGMGDFEKAKYWAFRAIETKEDWAEPWLALGKIFYFIALLGGVNEVSNWKKCIHFINIGLTYPPTKTLLFINPLDRECEIHKYLNLAYNKLGRVQEALDSVNKGMLKQPNDPNFINNKKLYEDFLARQKIVEHANIIKSNGTIDQIAVNNIQAIINAQIIDGNKEPKEQIISSIAKLKEEGYFSEFVADIMIPLVNKSIDPDKFFSKSFQPDNQFSKTVDVANYSSHKENWQIPTEIDLHSPTLKVSKEQLLASTIMIWKQYMSNNEFLAAETFLLNVPTEIRHNNQIKNAQDITKAAIENANKNIAKNKIVIGEKLIHTDAARDLESKLHLVSLSQWDVVEHFRKAGYRIQDCYVRDDQSIYVEGK